MPLLLLRIFSLFNLSRPLSPEKQAEMHALGLQMERNVEEGIEELNGKLRRMSGKVNPYSLRLSLLMSAHEKTTLSESSSSISSDDDSASVSEMDEGQDRPLLSDTNTACPMILSPREDEAANDIVVLENREQWRTEASKTSVAALSSGSVNSSETHNLLFDEFQKRDARKEVNKKLAAEEFARQEAEKRARQEAAERARQEAAERARQEAVERARQEAEGRARQEAEERARQEAAERDRQEAAERVRLALRDEERRTKAQTRRKEPYKDLFDDPRHYGK